MPKHNAEVNSHTVPVVIQWEANDVWGTNCPVWLVVTPPAKRHYSGTIQEVCAAITAGPFFSAIECMQWMAANSHHLSQRSDVYCISAYRSGAISKAYHQSLREHGRGTEAPKSYRSEEVVTEYADRLKQLEQALEQALGLLKSANSTDFGHTHGEPTYPQSVEWVERAKNEVLPALEAALAAKGGAA